MTIAQLITLGNYLSFLPPDSVFHHGDCIGADAQAHWLASIMKIDIEIHPPINDYARARCLGAKFVHPEKEFIARNHDIVNAADVVFATPSGAVEKFRGSGTWATMRYANKKGVKLFAFAPSGELLKY